MISLYPHQTEFINGLRAGLRSHDSVMGQAATGFGKTVVGAYIAKTVQSRGKRVIFTVHRKNLITQTKATFDDFGISHSHIAAGYAYDPGASVYVASIDSMRRRLDKVEAPDLLVIDEAHMAPARTWADTVNHYRELGSKILGLSATPMRLDGKPLSHLFDTIVHGPSVRWLMDEGFLSDYEAYAPSAPDLTGVRRQAGEYRRSELEEATDRPRITGDAAKHYRLHADGTRAIAYCVSIEHSRHVATHFNEAGIPAVHIDGTTPKADQHEAIIGLATGRYRVLCNVELITTGFDLSAQVGIDVPIETIIVLRPTLSVSLHLQMLGRGLRAKDNPAIILDHGGNLLRHGLPDDERAWELEGEAKRRTNTDPVIAIRQCEQCYFVHRPAPACPQCGYVYPVQARHVETVAGDLKKIDKAAIRRSAAAQEREADTYDKLVELGKERGYENPYGWANKRMIGRARSQNDLRVLAEQRGIKDPSAWAYVMWTKVKGKRRRAA